MGVSARSDFDLSNHAHHTGHSMTYHDDSIAGEPRQYVPHVIEPSVGLDR